MKTRHASWAGLALVLALAMASAGPAGAVTGRPDAIWARSTNGQAITLDGNLNEPAWAVADSIIIGFRTDSGVPGSGYQFEGGRVPSDSNFAVLKFLTVGNQLYMGARVKDKSIGGGPLFNRFDGFIMDLKDHSVPTSPKPVAEYTWTWWNDQLAAPVLNQAPTFYGRWGENPHGTPRTAEDIANWDAAYVVDGTVNEDTLHNVSPQTPQNDVGYTVEMRFNLTPMGYDVTQPNGDVVEWNISIYDCDWFWPLDVNRFSSNRVWWQDPWGNVGWYGEVRINAKPSVNITSGPSPTVAPELILPNAGSLAAPVIDGNLNDPVWAKAPHFDIRYGDDALRASYGTIPADRSGQFQPTVNASQAFVSDPGDATVYYIVKGNWLYFGFDVRDQYVQYVQDPDRWDGVKVILDDHTLRNADHTLQNRSLTFQVGPGPNANPPGPLLLAQDFLPFLRDTAGGALVALQLKPGTTIDTTGTDVDQGYTAELAVDLTKLGYPNGLGDGIVHLGIDLMDGDSFTPFTDSYSTRTWYGRERDNVCCPIYAYADPTAVVAVGDPGTRAPSAYVLLGAAPNPVRNLSTVKYSLGAVSRVSMELFDPAGRSIATKDLGVRMAGENAAVVPKPPASGIVFYRLRITDPASGAERATLSGKLTFLK